MSQALKAPVLDTAGFSCKPDVLTFSVNSLTKCSFASTTLFNSGSQPLAFSVSSHLSGVFRIEPPSGVLKEGQAITVFATMLHPQLAAESSSQSNPQSFNFDSVKILEGQGLRISIRSAVAAPLAVAPLLLSHSEATFPPLQPGNTIIAGTLKKVSQKQNDSDFEGSFTMKSRHVELCIAADGSPQLRYSHEASGPIRGFLPLQDVSCSVVSRGGHHAILFCVPATFSSYSPSSIDREVTVACDCDFQFEEDCKRAVFPSGPTTLFANQVVGDPKSSNAEYDYAYWTFEMSGNDAWACGLVPNSQQKNKNVLWDREESVGMHFKGLGSCFESINAPPGVEVTVFVEFASKICKFCCDGVVVAVHQVPEAEFPLTLGICGHNLSNFCLKPEKIAKFECLMAAQVGDSIFFPASGSSNPLHSHAPPHQRFSVLAVASGGGAAVRGRSASSEKCPKQPESLKFEFSSAHEFDIWRRALVHMHPSLTIDSTQSQHHSGLLPTQDVSSAHVNVPFSFLPDTRPLCEESCYICMERIWFAQEHSDAELASPSPSSKRAGAQGGLRAKRILSPKATSSHSGTHHSSVIWDGILPQCGHPIHTRCALRQLEQLPRRGDRFVMRSASCGMCRTTFKHHSLTRVLNPFQSRMAALFAKLKQEKDALSADVAADVESLAPDEFLSRHVFMLCTGCDETCYAGLHVCMAADEGGTPVAEVQSPSSRNGDACDKGGWRCVTCLNPNPEFPLSCSNPEHGENFIAFKCFYCCDVATFKCNHSKLGIRNFCGSCHKHVAGWDAKVIPEHRPGCNRLHPPNGSVPIFSLGCVPCRAKAPILVHDDKSRQEALLQASLAEARAIEAAAKAAEAAKAAKEAEAAAAARQSEIKAHKPELDHIMSMGFPLEESLAALRVCGFVPELALDFLISRAISKAAPADGHAQAGGAARAPPGDMDFQMFLQHREQREAAAPLMAMGFQEQDVIAAMQEFAGNMDAALNHLVEAAAIGAISIDPSAAAYVPRGAGASRSPSPPPPPVSLPSAAAASSAAPVFPQAVVSCLLEMGFDENSVMAALQATKGNANEAAMLLLSGAQP